MTEGTVFLPASSYFESDVASYVFDHLPNALERQIVQLAGNAPNVEHFVDMKRGQYLRERERYPRYYSERALKRLTGAHANWYISSRSASSDIAKGFLVC